MKPNSSGTSPVVCFFLSVVAAQRTLPLLMLPLLLQLMLLRKLFALRLRVFFLLVVIYE